MAKFTNFGPDNMPKKSPPAKKKKPMPVSNPNPGGGEKTTAPMAPTPTGMSSYADSGGVPSTNYGTGTTPTGVSGYADTGSTSTESGSLPLPSPNPNPGDGTNKKNPYPISEVLPGDGTPKPGIPTGDEVGGTNTGGGKKVWSPLLQKWFYEENGVDAATRRARQEAGYLENSKGKQAKGTLDLVTGALSDPSKIVERAGVRKIADNANSNQFVDPSLANVDGTNPLGSNSAGLSTASSANAFEVAKVDPKKAMEDLKASLEQFRGPDGKVSKDSLIQAITKDPATLAALGLDVSQIQEPVTIDAPDPRVLNSAEMISGAAVNWAKVEAKAQVEAATANPSKKATVAGQLENLMADFNGKNPPPWAAGAIRNANAQLQARGIGASSIAGQAVLQAAMESALPIASADAQTYARFELENLSNKQAAAMLQAEQRASFLGMEFDQEFQSKVANAARVSDIANMNFTAEQQVALENARLAQTVDLSNLNAVNAKVMADAAAMSQMDMANLSSMQQASVGNAQAFLSMDFKNLDNKQQNALFTQQAYNNQILTDQAAENAAKQINAGSENQVNTFMANLVTQTNQFNSAQSNAMSQYNTSEMNAMDKFNTQVENQKQQFEATMGLEISQSNAKWRRDIAVTDANAENISNMEFARTANGITQQTLDNLWQRERDLMSFAFSAAEGYEDRNLQLLLADKQIGAEESSKNKEGIGYLVGSLLFG